MSDAALTTEDRLRWKIGQLEREGILHLKEIEQLRKENKRLKWDIKWLLGTSMVRAVAVGMYPMLDDLRRRMRDEG